MSTPATPPTKRSKQLIQTYRMAKKSDRRIGLITLGAFLLGALVGFAVIYLLPGTGLLSLILSIVGAILAAGASNSTLATVLGFVAVTFATINVVGGFMVTDRMLEMFKRDDSK